MIAPFNLNILWVVVVASGCVFDQSNAQGANQVQDHLRSEQRSRLQIIDPPTGKSLALPIPKTELVRDWSIAEHAGEHVLVVNFESKETRSREQYSLLEVWIDVGSETRTIVAQLTKDLPTDISIPGLGTNRPVLLSKEASLGQLRASYHGSSIKIRIDKRILPSVKPFYITTRWLPKSLPSGTRKPDLLLVSATSLNLDESALMWVEPNLRSFFEPLSRDGGE